MELVRAVVGGDLPLEELMELEQEALAETGNVILNGCLGTIANNLQHSLRISLPEVVYGDGAEFFSLAPPPNVADGVLFIYINFLVRERDITGYIAMLLDLPVVDHAQGDVRPVHRAGWRRRHRHSIPCLLASKTATSRFSMRSMAG